MANVFNYLFETYEVKGHITNKNIIVGDHTYYSGYHKKEHFEDFVWYLDPNADENVDRLIIGKYCQIAGGVVFVMGGNQGHKYDWVTTFPFFYDNTGDWGENVKNAWKSKGDTVVGNDVLLGTESLIMPGVHIGDGAIIASRAVVTKDVEPYTIVGGNPAKLIKKRFSDKHIKMLLALKWWDFPDDIIDKHMEILCSDRIEALYDSLCSCK